MVHAMQFSKKLGSYIYNTMHFKNEVTQEAHVQAGKLPQATNWFIYGYGW